ncbi:AraC family transcriptional regulator [Paenibacillus sp. N4]|uniref:helix-turn-helix domain-containing protein n=1 Tax=Paenibacillus vietnamensis TaxID=2590547 RepID=UPI001CD0EE3E|nr:helix-turn-helix domain-containing protein [Paenibacillus vietnamensis]MCA0753580.1 AraC family transcriptional regulator [Paenibacillus vietnamensis]
MKKNWYRKLLLSYFPIFLFTVTILVFLSFIALNDISHKETAKADRMTTGYIVDRLSRSLKGIEMDVLEEVEKNDIYSDFLDAGQSGNDREALFDVVDSMRSLIASDTLIDSIYIYRNKDKQVLTRSGMVEWSGFADKAYIEQALDNPDNRVWSSIRTYREFSIETDKRVISMFKRWPLPFGTDGIIVINVDMYAVERMIRSMNNDEVSFLNVRDGQGKMIFSTQAAGTGESGEPGGSVLNRVPSDLLGWTFESGSNTGQLFVWLSVISYVWVVIGIITVLFAIIYMIYITRKNYKPIRLMMNRIESIQLSKGEFGTKLDELSMIDMTLETLIKQSADYEKQQRENLLVGRRQLFHDIIQGERLEAVEERLMKLRLLPEGTTLDRPAFVVVEIGQYGDFRSGFSLGDQNTLKFALTNVLQELAQAGGMFGWAEWIAENRMGIIVNVSGGEQDAKERIRSFADTGRGWVTEHLRMSLLFGVGFVTDDWQRLGQSYKAAVKALEHKMSLGKEAVIMSEDLPAGEGRKWYKYVQMCGELVKEFRLITGEWRVHLDAFFAQLEADRLKDEDIRTLLQTMTDMLGSELSSVSEQMREHFAGEQAEARKKVAEETVSLEQLKSVYLDDFTEIYRTYVAYSETKNHRAMINEMKAYIEEHFENPDLSLKHLSDRFQISGKYASYLFKEEFNMKFVDFIVQLRIERAEELLAGTEEPIQSIALKVGYANSITFGRVFKRVVGVTPGDFRKLKMKPGNASQFNDF